MESKARKKLLLTIGSVISVIVIIWGAAGVYTSALPFFFILLLAGVGIIIVANKIKTTKTGEDPDGMMLPEKWKCRCGSYNDNSQNNCQICGQTKVGDGSMMKG